jgi:hypothetical protein
MNNIISLSFLNIKNQAADNLSMVVTVVLHPTSSLLYLLHHRAFHSGKFLPLGFPVFIKFAQ